MYKLCGVFGFGAVTLGIFVRTKNMLDSGHDPVKTSMTMFICMLFIIFGILGYDNVIAYLTSDFGGKSCFDEPRFVTMLDDFIAKEGSGMGRTSAKDREDAFTAIQKLNPDFSAQGNSGVTANTMSREDYLKMYKDQTVGVSPGKLVNAMWGLFCKGAVKLGYGIGMCVQWLYAFLVNVIFKIMVAVSPFAISLAMIPQTANVAVSFVNSTMLMFSVYVSFLIADFLLRDIINQIMAIAAFKASTGAGIGALTAIASGTEVMAVMPEVLIAFIVCFVISIIIFYVVVPLIVLKILSGANPLGAIGETIRYSNSIGGALRHAGVGGGGGGGKGRGGGDVGGAAPGADAFGGAAGAVAGGLGSSLGGPLGGLAGGGLGGAGAGAVVGAIKSVGGGADGASPAGGAGSPGGGVGGAAPGGGSAPSVSGGAFSSGGRAAGGADSGGGAPGGGAGGGSDVGNSSLGGVVPGGGVSRGDAPGGDTRTGSAPAGVDSKDASASGGGTSGGADPAFSNNIITKGIKTFGSSLARASGLSTGAQAGKGLLIAMGRAMTAAEQAPAFAKGLSGAARGKVRGWAKSGESSGGGASKDGKGGVR